MLNASVGKETFGYDRYLNQIFYKSSLWRSIRDKIIIRDCGCDLGLLGYDIVGSIIIHHMNPITVDDVERNSDLLTNPEYLICVSDNTHRTIHYGHNNKQRLSFLIERRPNDTCPWRS